MCPRIASERSWCQHLRVSTHIENVLSRLRRSRRAAVSGLWPRSYWSAVDWYDELVRKATKNSPLKLMLGVFETEQKNTKHFLQGMLDAGDPDKMRGDTLDSMMVNWGMDFKEFGCEPYTPFFDTEHADHHQRIKDEILRALQMNVPEVDVMGIHIATHKTQMAELKKIIQANSDRIYHEMNDGLLTIAVDYQEKGPQRPRMVEGAFSTREFASYLERLSDYLICTTWPNPPDTNIGGLEIIRHKDRTPLFQPLPNFRFDNRCTNVRMTRRTRVLQDHLLRTGTRVKDCLRETASAAAPQLSRQPFEGAASPHFPTVRISQPAYCRL